MSTDGGGGFLLARAFVDFETRGYRGVISQIETMRLAMRAIVSGGTSANPITAVAAGASRGAVGIRSMNAELITANRNVGSAASLMGIAANRMSMVGNAAAFGASRIAIFGNAFRFAMLAVNNMNMAASTAAGSLLAVNRGMRDMTPLASSAAGSLGGVNRMLVAMGAIVGGRFLLMMAGDAQMAQEQFAVMLGGMQQSIKLLSQLRGAAMKTPFEFPELRESAALLLGAGEAADGLIERLTMLGDISAGSGKRMNELVVIFGQIRNAGRLLGQDLRQLEQARIGGQLIQSIAAMKGVSTRRVREMVSEGAVSFQDVADAMKQMTSEGGVFFNMMERKTGTMLGQWSNVRDAFSRIAEIIGAAFVPAITKALTLINSMFTKWTSEVAMVIAGVAAFVGAIYLLTTAINMARNAQILFLAFSGPKGWAILAAGAAAAAAAIYAVDEAYDQVAKKAKEAANAKFNEGMPVESSIKMEKESRFAFVGLTDFTRRLQEGLTSGDKEKAVENNTKAAADSLARIERDGIRIHEGSVKLVLA